jgi:hypothetical protein
MSIADLLDEVEDLPPGPDLGDVLAGIDPRGLNGTQLVDLIAARQRQLCFEQAQLLVAVRELAYSPADAVGATSTVRDTSQDPYARMELAFALTWTEYRAADLVATALSTVDKTPAMLAAMLSGQADLDKARVVSDELAEIDDVAQARAIVDRLLPELGRCTTAQLRVRIRRLILSVHPDKVRTRHTKTVAQRSVAHQEYANGTASLSGWYLSKDKAAAAWDHIDAIARATRTAGDPAGRGIDQIRADVFADLLAGVDPTRSGAATPAPRKGVIHLTIGLTTLACLDDQPADIAGFGPIPAELARQIATQMATTADWRYAVVDDNGELAAEGRLRYRPTAAQTAFIRARDRTCRAPGCRRPAMNCHIDHNLDWAHGGPTLISNLCNLCAAHHGGKHQGRYRLRRGPYGMRWTTPRGRHYTVLGETTHAPSPLEHHTSDIHIGHQSHLRR